MPELPEVQTTVNGLKQTIIGLVIKDVWTDYNSPYFKGSGTIKDPAYYKYFKKEIIGRKVVAVDRRAKNILIRINSSSVILVHMKMTGHLLYGNYKFDSKQKDPWQPIKPDSLKDPFNRHIHFVISFSNGKQLALSDTRKFAKVTLIEGHVPHEKSPHLNTLGPEPLATDFNFEKFKNQIDKKPNGKIKLVLLDQNIIAGIGNIYADEALWRAGIHPLERVKNIPAKTAELLFQAIRKTLSSGITLGGTSTSDYRNVFGEKGEFQGSHKAYQRTGLKCSKPGCKGIIKRIVVGSRATHFCHIHQRLSTSSR